VQVENSIALIYGLEKRRKTKWEFEDGTIGIALNLEEISVGAVYNG